MALKMIPLAFFVVFLLAKNFVDATIGINWGRQSAQRLVPSQVVDLLLQNGIREARIHSSEVDLLKAFVGTEIGLTMTVSNLTHIRSPEDSKRWIQEIIHYLEHCNIRRIYIAEYAFADAFNKTRINEAMQTMQNLQNALNEVGYRYKVKVTIPHHPEILMMNMKRPSEAEFRDEIKQDMTTFLRLLQQNDAPFVWDMFPIIHIDDFRFDLSFAFIDKKSTQLVRDINGAIYTNLFEFMYDSYAWALTKLDASNIKMIVAQVGWPTDGYTNANVTMAERFFKGLLPLVASNKGTPMRPRAPIDIYIHSLTDENQMPYNGAFMRHWGIYRSNGKPKYKIDLSGQGRDIYPTDAEGIRRMPERWCLFNGDETNMSKVLHELKKACNLADCTSTAPGGSCSRLSFHKNISYSFNMYFQFQFQDEKACEFEGLGYLTVEDPSTDECVFPVEVVKGHQRNLLYPPTGRPAGKGFREMPNCAIFVFLLSILGTLFWR